MAYQASPVAPFLKGVVASNQPLALPKGIIVRDSNMLMLERGALTPCDGSAVINAFDGEVQSGFGRMEASTLFAPAAVSSYYLVIERDVAPTSGGQPLGPPQHLTAASGGSGSLAAGLYVYQVTAIDGAGGETTAAGAASLTVGANGAITLTWNVVPNAYAYNVYRAGSGGGTPLILIGTGLPVLQPNPITATVSYTDGGTTTTPPIGGNAIQNIFTPKSGSNPQGIATLSLTSPAAGWYLGKQITISGNSNGLFNSAVTITGIQQGGGQRNTIFQISNTAFVGQPRQFGTGGTAVDPGPPATDTTQQVVLYQMPGGATLPISYSRSNIVAYYPNSMTQLGVPPPGGGMSGTVSSTPSGGIIGMTSMIPQFRQFTGRMIIALGNGFNPQAFWDSTGTTINPAPTTGITSVSVDAYGVVTVTVVGSSLTETDPTKATFLVPGSNVILAGITNSLYDGVFVVISVTTGSGIFKVRNLAAIGQASSSGGTWTMSTCPLISTFTPAYPEWASDTNYPTGSIIVPKSQPMNSVYLTAIQGGESGGSEPSWPDPVATNQAFPLGNIADGSIIWQETGYLNSAAPPPPGTGHIEVYANSLWMWNTYPIDGTNGLDGPCSLRMSGQGNPFYWNPVNQAFLDKDDGYEGQGLAKFTITALGIPPEGSLVAFKNRSPYQIIGVFGASNFAIQAVSSDMGCIAPRTVQFVPGFGIGRYTHMGFAIFDGVRDTLISEQIRPYLFMVNDFDALDITPTDQAFTPISWAALTANPPQYCIACPVGTNGTSMGELTRIFCYDLVLKAWSIVDLPFPISCITQVQQSSPVPITLMAGFADGCLQRWQSGDIEWYTGIPASELPVSWSFRTGTIASQNSDQRLYMRRIALRGTNTGGVGTLTVTPRQSAIPFTTITCQLPAAGDFDLFVDIAFTGLRFDAIIAGAAHIELDGLTWHLEPRPIGVLTGVI